MLGLYLLLGAATLATCLCASRIGRCLGVIDMPDGGRKHHERPTPLVGGLAVVSAMFAAAGLAALATDLDRLYVVLGLSVLAFLVLGFIDDRAHIRPQWRLALSFALCFAVLEVVPGLQVSFLKFSFLPVTLFLDGWPAVAFTLLCLVGLQNSVNMADGRNGLVIGLMLVWTGLLFAHAPVHLHPLLGVLALALAITLVFNMKGRLFLGDSGSYALSIGIGLLAIYCYQVNFSVLFADKVALLFLIPVVDCLRLMAARVVRGRSPFSSDGDHLHHILSRLMPWRRALPVYLALVAVPNLLALAWPQHTLLWAVATLTSYAMLVGVGTRARLVAAGRGRTA